MGTIHYGPSLRSPLFLAPFDEKGSITSQRVKSERFKGRNTYFCTSALPLLVHARSTADLTCFYNAAHPSLWLN